MLDFTFFTGTSNGFETFCTVFLYKFFIFPICFRIFRVTEVWWIFESLKTVLFSQIAVIASLFAYVGILVEASLTWGHRIVIAYSG